nr:MAG TPA: hypothetical protein [Crassvirales sp.]DAR29014.1 MAG TPA: hypothetical protein [Crassvirales sp.]
MYMIEITEDKVDCLMEHVSKGLKCFNKAMDCLEEIKEHSSHNNYEEDDYGDEEYDERYNNHMNKSNNRDNTRRSHGGGRYSRY